MTLRTLEGAALRVAHHYSTMRTEGDMRVRDPEQVHDLTVQEWLALLASYDGRCAYCGHFPSETPGDRLMIDHTVPVKRGGSHTLCNVLPACETCNSKKGEMTPLEWLAVRAGIVRRTGPKRRYWERVFIQPVNA